MASLHLRASRAYQFVMPSGTMRVALPALRMNSLQVFGPQRCSALVGLAQPRSSFKATFGFGFFGHRNAYTSMRGLHRYKLLGAVQLDLSCALDIPRNPDEQHPDRVSALPV